MWFIAGYVVVVTSLVIRFQGYFTSAEKSLIIHSASTVILKGLDNKSVINNNKIQK